MRKKANTPAGGGIYCGRTKRWIRYISSLQDRSEHCSNSLCHFFCNRQVNAMVKSYRHTVMSASENAPTEVLVVTSYTSNSPSFCANLTVGKPGLATHLELTRPAVHSKWWCTLPPPFHPKRLTGQQGGPINLNDLGLSWTGH